MFRLISSKRVCSVSSSGFSPTDSSSSLIRSWLRYGPSESTVDSLFANWRKRSERADISHSPKAMEPGLFSFVELLLISLFDLNELLP